MAAFNNPGLDPEEFEKFKEMLHKLSPSQIGRVVDFLNTCSGERIDRERDRKDVLIVKASFTSRHTSASDRFAWHEDWHDHDYM